MSDRYEITSDCDNDDQDTWGPFTMEEALTMLPQIVAELQKSGETLNWIQIQREDF